MFHPQMGRLSDKLLDWSATLPWWLVGAFAILLFAVLNAMGQSAYLPSAGRDTGYPPAHHDLLRAMASNAQFAVPEMLLVIGAASYWRRRQRQRLLQKTASNPAEDALHHMSWQDFKLLVGEAFRLKGYEVDEVGRGGPEEGMDLVLWKNDQKAVVQCKQWRSYRAGVEVVRELIGVMQAIGADAGFLVTSGTFSPSARQFAAGQHVMLLDGQALRELIAQVQRAQASKTPRSAPAPTPLDAAGPLASRHGEVQPPIDPAVLLALAQAREAVIPSCPHCKRAMQRHSAKPGSPGTPGIPSFWGCTAYPACRGTRPLITQHARIDSSA